jgi:hypothetical protein
MTAREEMLQEEIEQLREEVRLLREEIRLLRLVNDGHNERRRLIMEVAPEAHGVAPERMKLD